MLRARGVLEYQRPLGLVKQRGAVPHLARGIVPVVIGEEQPPTEAGAQPVKAGPDKCSHLWFPFAAPRRVSGCAADRPRRPDAAPRASNNGINRAPGKPSRAAGVFAVPPASSEGDQPLVAVEDAVQNQTLEDR